MSIIEDLNNKKNSLAATLKESNSLMSKLASNSMQCAMIKQMIASLESEMKEIDENLLIEKSTQTATLKAKLHVFEQEINVLNIEISEMVVSLNNKRQHLLIRTDEVKKITAEINAIEHGRRIILPGNRIVTPDNFQCPLMNQTKEVVTIKKVKVKRKSPARKYSFTSTRLETYLNNRGFSDFEKNFGSIILKGGRKVAVVKKSGRKFSCSIDDDTRFICVFTKKKVVGVHCFVFYRVDQLPKSCIHGNKFIGIIDDLSDFEIDFNSIFC